MASSYSQIYFHAVFAVKFREALISPIWENDLFKVMSSQLIDQGLTPIVINGTEDHVHMLWRHKRTVLLPDTMKAVKGNGSHFINQKKLTERLFRFQHGYGVFSVSPDRVSSVSRYITNQKEHHRKLSLEKEYDKLLLASGVRSLPKYRFDHLI